MRAQDRLCECILHPRGEVFAVHRGGVRADAFPIEAGQQMPFAESFAPAQAKPLCVGGSGSIVAA